jgi:hypothetical protein
MIKALFYKGLGVKESKRVRGCDNSTYPKGGVSCSKDSFGVNQTLVFQIKFCGKSPALRVAANRYAKALATTKNENLWDKYYLVSVRQLVYI